MVTSSVNVSINVSLAGKLTDLREEPTNILLPM